MASAELRDTRRRIKSVQSTMKITRAMELIAASRIPRAVARVSASKPYSAKLVDVIRNVAVASGGASHMLLEQRPVRRAGILVVSSDRGLAGAYASTIIREAERNIVALERSGTPTRLFVVGKKAQTYFQYRKYHIERSFLGVTDAPGYGDARALAATLMDAYASEVIDSVDAYYTRFKSALTQTPTHFQLLPIAPPETGEVATSVDYSYEPSPAQILDRLLPRYVESTVFSMLLEASASEHSARRRAMKAATENADELIRVLTRIANRARQGEITTEISEIVGGAEALAQQKS
ncbi:MAG: F0F1 ATP synthase subunit gamma [Acidimicrobiia bacterium]|nr:F0F1 ATP synthase subunit gamma [Acidimicrobiia bacterium]